MDNDIKCMHNSSVDRSHQSPSLPTVAISPSNSFISIVEELVNAPKEAVEMSGGRRKHHAPSNFILRVKVIQGHSNRLKVIAIKAGGQWFISLVTEQGEVLRQYHYQYNTHPNPDGSTVGRSHKHFPTRRYPLRKRHKDIQTWAYDPEPFPHDFEDAVKHFCEECNITIQSLQERLNLRWFR